MPNFEVDIFDKMEEKHLDADGKEVKKATTLLTWEVKKLNKEINIVHKTRLDWQKFKYFFQRKGKRWTQHSQTACPRACFPPTFNKLNDTLFAGATIGRIFSASLRFNDWLDTSNMKTFAITESHFLDSVSEVSMREEGQRRLQARNWMAQDWLDHAH